jgi:hypothetical protein
MSGYRRNDDYVNGIKRLLAQRDISTYEFGRLPTGQRAVVITHAGKETTVCFPFSDSDWRGPRNVVREVRRALGL